MASTGCGTRQTGDSATADAKTPVYHASRDVVFDATCKVFSTKFKRLDTQDRKNYKVVGTETNWPGGDTQIEVTLRKIDADNTAVDVVASSAATASPGWNKTERDFQNFLTWLDDEMKNGNKTTIKPDSAQERLEEIDKLHSHGLLRDDEYEARRKAIIDSL